MDESKREDELRDDPLLEETAQGAQDPVSESQQAAGDNVSPEPVDAAAEDEQIEPQAAGAGPAPTPRDRHDPHQEDGGSGENEGSRLTAGPLFKEQEADMLRSRWLDVQSSFVDDPEASVEAADRFISQVVDDIRSNLVNRRSVLQSQLHDGDGSSDTEDLRHVIRSYRSLLDRLLEIEL